MLAEGAGQPFSAPAVRPPGLSNIEIAERTYLSINPVKSYIRPARRTMGVASRSRAILWVSGWLNLHGKQWACGHFRSVSVATSDQKRARRPSRLAPSSEVLVHRCRTP